MWENNEDNGQYGTTMALMLLPYWTDGCIASMEGLFFEASGTTPYHFLTTAAMSKQSSNPVRELRYDNNDADGGVPYLQALGVRTDGAHRRGEGARRPRPARADAARRAVGPVGDLSRSPTPTSWCRSTVQPVVVNHRAGDQRERNLELGTSWFQHPDEWAAMPADDGPADWQRIDVAVDETRRDAADAGRPETQAGRHRRAGRADRPGRAAAGRRCSDVEIGEQDVSFHVDQVGVPVLVKVSYFPNWEADGAEGPYRIAPNLMVVVPTSQRRDADVRPQSALDCSSTLSPCVGIVLLIFMADPRRRASRRDAPAVGPPPESATPAVAERLADGSMTSTAEPDPGPIASTRRHRRRPLDPSPTRHRGRPQRMPSVGRRSGDRAGGRRTVTADGPRSLDGPSCQCSTRSSRRTTSAAPCPTSSTPRSPTRSASPSPASPVPPSARRPRHAPAGPELVDAFTDGVLEQGVDVVDLGLASSDLVYFAAGHLDAPGAMFTASHNPAEYNGVKFCLAGRPAGRRRHRPRRDQGRRRAGARRPRPAPAPPRPAGSEPRPAAAVRRPRACRSSTRRRCARCASSPTPPTAWAASSCRRCSSACRRSSSR